ncbi:MAG TPA: polysaccharide deacetylase family protein [Methanocella sp.]|uniref:polysaccharide deacetylase family protein n=1 Tax=Methanocella sp. TaxID=2052833 RepID=UPI002BC6ACB5|nr:polysaccharide deacetylase family protein [Methanocella sp.]HTY90748.1 polysaccharide deacetylase family protein [Methanocella sp.]
MSYPIDQILRQKNDFWDLYTFKNEAHNNQAYDDVKDVKASPLFLDPYMSSYLMDNGLKAEYPDGKKFAVCLTHDVDDIYPPPLHTVASSIYSLGHLDFNEFIDHSFWTFKGKDHSPYINFKEIMEIEEKYDARSTFFFMAADRDIRRFRYNVDDLSDKLGALVDRGFEVGLHGGYYSYRDPDLILTEKKRITKILNKDIVGYRNHYLKFKIPESWEYLARCGFRYDATIGNNRVIGFKNGLCHPFKPSLADNKSIDIVELPLVLADFTLFNAGIPMDRLWEIARTMIDRVEKCGGVATILWHSDVFSASYRKPWVKFYIKLLDYCRLKNSWMASGDQVSEWIRKGY